MIKQNKRIPIALFLFLAFVLVYTRMDFLIHSELYAYGLQFNQKWFGTNQIIYFFMFQLAIVVCTYIAQNWKFLIFTEAFVLSATQDLIFFTWNSFNYPVGDWTWMPFYSWFGAWTTVHQLVFSISVLAITLTALRMAPQLYVLLKTPKK